jgi:hypothetical protein
LLLSVSTLFAKNISLAWDASPDGNIVGYAIYYAASGSSQYQRVEVGNSTSHILIGIQPGASYNLFSTAIDPTGAESLPSNLISFEAPADDNLLQNGSFEDSFNGWSAGGHLAIDAMASAGQQSVRFNYGQLAANGMLSQRFPTTPGRSYTVAFDLGAFSILFSREQMMVVSVKGSSVLAAQAFSIVSDGNGQSWQSQSFGFTADGSTATILFQDASATTDSVDISLDNVRVTQDQP